MEARSWVVCPTMQSSHFNLSLHGNYFIPVLTELPPDHLEEVVGLRLGGRLIAAEDGADGLLGPEHDRVEAEAVVERGDQVPAVRGVAHDGVLGHGARGAEAEEGGDENGEDSRTPHFERVVEKLSEDAQRR